MNTLLLRVFNFPGANQSRVSVQRGASTSPAQPNIDIAPAKLNILSGDNWPPQRLITFF